MSSPNEPGYPRAGDAPGSGNGSVGGSSPHDGGSLGSAASRTGQRHSALAARPGRTGGPAAAAPVAGFAPRGRSSRQRGSDGPAGHSPGVDARLNRFIAGGPGSSAPAPTHEQEAPARGERTETVRPESYASELPDLSGPMPRTPQQRKPARRTAQVGRARRPAASKSAPGTQAPCGPACRSAGSTRGAR